LLMTEHIDGEIYALEQIEETPYFTSCVTKHENKLVISLVNAHLTEEKSVCIDLSQQVSGRKVIKGRIRRLEAEDIHNENIPGQPEQVYPTEEEFSVEGEEIQVYVEKHSLCVVILETENL